MNGRCREHAEAGASLARLAHAPGPGTRLKRVAGNDVLSAPITALARRNTLKFVASAGAYIIVSQYTAEWLVYFGWLRHNGFESKPLRRKLMVPLLPEPHTVV